MPELPEVENVCRGLSQIFTAEPRVRRVHLALDLQVYGRVKKPCLACGTLIARAVQAGRSTFWCPKCQK